MAIMYQRPKRQGVKKDLHNLQLGKLFLKPSQGIFGIRRAGTPKWSQAGLEVLKPIRGEMAAKGIASHCLGKRGREFFKCLKNAAGNLAYAGKSGFWWALQDKPVETIQYSAQHRFIDMNVPDTAKMNARRIVHYVLSGMTLDQAARQGIVLPADLFDDKRIEQSVKPENRDKVMNVVTTMRKAFKEQIPVLAEQFARYLEGIVPAEAKDKLATITSAAVAAAIEGQIPA